MELFSVRIRCLGVIMRLMPCGLPIVFFATESIISFIRLRPKISKLEASELLLPINLMVLSNRRQLLLKGQGGLIRVLLLIKTGRPIYIGPEEIFMSPS